MCDFSKVVLPEKILYIQLQEEFSSPILPMPTDQMDRDQLQNKLRELQDKKSRMDAMLQELQSLRSNPAFPLNNGKLFRISVEVLTVEIQNLLK